MNYRRALLLGAVASIAASMVPNTSARDLTFEERVLAQEAIERVRHSHLVGSRRSFEQAMPREAIESKVRAYLEHSEALETIGHTSVTAAMLEKEMARIAKGSRMPERLRELYAALGNDPVLIAECIARPALVARLTQSFPDDSRDFDPKRVAPAADLGDLELPASSEAAESCVPDDTWDNGSLDDVPDPTSDPKAIWTGTEMVVWGGFHLSRGGKYDPVTDTWSLTSVIGAPVPRLEFTMVWTGDRVLVWGGRSDGYDELNTGGLYDPQTDTWTPTSVTGAPSGRYAHTAVWTGTRMIVWGGYDGAAFVQTGGLYDPDTDTWMPTTTQNAPEARWEHAAVWASGQMVIWGGAVFDPAQGGVPTNTGGRYDPVSNTWLPTSTAGSLFPRTGATAVWTGSRVLLWGGVDDPARASDLGQYDPATDTWAVVSSFVAPAWRYDHTAVWTGTELIVWGGHANGAEANSGGRYNPSTNTWASTSTLGAPSPREDHVAVWTGTQMIVWGGYDGGNTGGRYDPATDTWTPTRTAFLALSENVSVWTGNEMILWGGEYPDAPGARYDPVLDTWTAVTTVNEPDRRSYHTAVWSGDEMIVWGGSRGNELGTGGRYDPSTDTWRATSNLNAPDPRYSHAAVWTGNRMIVWGGAGHNMLLATGGSYDPVTNAWTATSTTDAPIARQGPTAVWTGSKMIVWGGVNHGSVRTGGVYDPTTDTWTATSLTNAPKRFGHTAVWTGTRMVVWGGSDDVSFPAAGASYDPVSNAWTSTSVVGAPSGRLRHTAVWTGTRMIVFGGSGNVDSEPLPGAGWLYDPTTDSWSAASLTNAPAPRYGHAAQWTGDLMLVWGGTGGPGTGGRYAFGQSVDVDGDGYTTCGGDCDDSSSSIHPGAVELCDSLDNDCDFSIDEGVPLPTTRPSVSVGKLGTATSLSWAPLSDATGYDAVKGNLGPLRNSNGNFTTATKACIANDVAAATVSDGEVPPPTGGLWFVVRSVNACSGAGTYDEPGSSQQGSRDAEIAASASACP
jgi:N-acetylneuraminic acid mutarotase